MSEPWLLFADCETTGLGRGAELLEVGFRIVDRDLSTLAEKAWVIPWSSDEIAEFRHRADPFVREMHDRSGLWIECVEQWATELVDGDMHGGRWFHDLLYGTIMGWLIDIGAGGLPLAGSSVHVDRAWLERIPGFSDLIHYRNMDVSTLKILLGEWRTEATIFGPTPKKLHRALPDLDDTIEELAHYRDALGLNVAEVAGG